MSPEVIFWLAAFVVLLVIEIATMGLTTIWFCGGAVAALIAAALGGPIWLQAVLFIVVSVVLLVLTRPLAVKHLNNKTVRTNADSLVGEEAVVAERICNLESTGRVKIHGQEWAARTTDDSVAEAGEVVKVISIAGVKLMVEKE